MIPAMAQDGGINGDGTIVAPFGTKLPRNRLEGKTGCPREERIALSVTKNEFVTFALDKMGLFRRKARGEEKGRVETTKGLGSSRYRRQCAGRGTTVQLCGDSEVVEKWINGIHSVGDKYQRDIGPIQRTLHIWCEKKAAAKYLKRVCSAIVARNLEFIQQSREVERGLTRCRNVAKVVRDKKYIWTMSLRGAQREKQTCSRLWERYPRRDTETASRRG